MARGFDKEEPFSACPNSFAGAFTTHMHWVVEAMLFVQFKHVTVALKSFFGTQIREHHVAASLSFHHKLAAVSPGPQTCTARNTRTNFSEKVLVIHPMIFFQILFGATAVGIHSRSMAVLPSIKVTDSAIRRRAVTALEGFLKKRQHPSLLGPSPDVNCLGWENDTTYAAQCALGARYVFEQACRVAPKEECNKCMSDTTKAKWVLYSNSMSQLPAALVAAHNVFFHRFMPKEFFLLSSNKIKTAMGGRSVSSSTPGTAASRPGMVRLLQAITSRSDASAMKVPWSEQIPRNILSNSARRSKSGMRDPELATHSSLMVHVLCRACRGCAEAVFDHRGKEKHEFPRHCGIFAGGNMRDLPQQLLDVACKGGQSTQGATTADGPRILVQHPTVIEASC